MPVDIKKLKKYLVFAISALFAAFSLGTVIYYIIYPSAAFFHSDCADTILWAQASHDCGGLFNPDFGYAAMLPFGGTMLMAPFIGIFGVSMTTHHIGMVLFTLLMAASVFLLCRSLKFSYPLSFTTLGTLLAVLCASAKLREIFYEHVIYYSICVAVICVLLSLLIKFKEAFGRTDSSKPFIVCAVFTILFSACAGLDGLQIISMGIIPVLFAAVAEILMNGEQKIFSKENRASLFYCIICSFSALIGLGITAILSNGVNAGYANAYSGYDDMTDWLANLGKFPLHWFMLFGVDAEYGMSIFSPESIVNIIRIAAAVIIAVVPIIALICYKKFDLGSRLLILAHFGLSAVIMFGYVFGILSAANWRLSPMICTGLLVCFAVLKAAKGYVVPMRFAAVSACILLLMSGVSFKNIAGMDKNGIVQNEKYQLAMILKDNGLSYGFATFWNSQAITVLSDSEVRAVNVDVNDNGISPAVYQTNKQWFNEQAGVDRYFVLLSQAEISTLMSTPDWNAFQLLTKEIIDLDGYRIFVFDSLYFLLDR